MRGFKLGGFIHRIMDIIYDLLILNLIWAITSIPIITIGASTTSLFYCVGRLVRKEELSILRDYMRSFKLNFKQGTLIWCILVTIYFMIYTNIIFFSEISMTWAKIIVYTQLPILVTLVLTTLFIFPLLSRFNCEIVKLFKVSLILGIKNFFKGMECLCIIFLGVLSIRYIPAIALFLLFSSIAIGIYKILNKVLEEGCEVKSAI